MELFPQIDEKQTIKNAKKFLKYTFPKWILQSGLSAADIKSPSISDIPSGTPYGNANEKKYIHMLERQKDVRNVLRAIDAPANFERLILREVYLNHTPDWKVANRIGYGNTRYKELKNQALISFGYAMEAYDVNLVKYL